MIVCVCVYWPSQVLWLNFRWPIGWRIECPDLLMYPYVLGLAVEVRCLSVFMSTVCYFSRKRCVIWWKHSGVCSTSWLAQLNVPGFYVLHLWRLQQDMSDSFFFLWDLTKYGKFDFFAESRQPANFFINLPCVLMWGHICYKGKVQVSGGEVHSPPDSAVYLKYGSSRSSVNQFFNLLQL